MIDKTDFFKSICQDREHFSYTKVVEYGNKLAGVINNNHAKKIITDSIHFFHHEKFENYKTHRRKKRFRICIHKYGVTDFPKNMNDVVCPKVIAAMTSRAMELVEIKRKKGNDVFELRQSILQFFKVVGIRSELKISDAFAPSEN